MTGMYTSHLFHNKVYNWTSLLDITRILSFGIILLVFLFVIPLEAEEECLHSRLWCYECNSWKDSRCKDPFNESSSLQEPALLKRCEGCCVKIVTDKGTPQEAIRRTCTSNLQINLFLVDHVCMKESEGKGTMCFCESEACNSVPPLITQNDVLFWSLSLSIIIGGLYRL